jgi:hypothetical protein
MSAKKKYTPDESAALRQFRDAKIAEQADPAAQARRTLANHERVIENGLRSFVEMGRALQDIRADKLYGIDGYSDFDEYLAERWEMTPRQAYRLISAARVALILRPMGHKIDSERVARELAPIAEDPEMMCAVYEEAARRAGGGRVTAALIAAARDALAPTVIEGELADDEGEQTESEALVEALRTEIEDVAANQTAAGAATPPADGEIPTAFQGSPATGAGASEADRPAPVVTPETTETANLGADDAGPSSSARPSTGSLGESLGDETGPEVPSSKAPDGPADERESQDRAGVSQPATLASDEDAKAEVRREMRERMTQRFCDSIVTLTQGAARRDPVKWIDEVYLPGAYKVRDMPRVAECFTPESLKELARQIYTLADHLHETGRELL